MVKYGDDGGDDGGDGSGDDDGLRDRGSSLKCQRICCHEHMLGKRACIFSANARHMGVTKEGRGVSDT